MSFDSPDIETFKSDLENNIVAVKKLKRDSHASIKIQSLLNITIYVLATRYLEGSIKHIIYNCCVMRGDDSAQLRTLESELKKFNNPEYTKIQELFLAQLNYDITYGLTNNFYETRDISLLNEIVTNRHRNVHTTHDPLDWHSKNLKDINDFNKEFVGLQNILTFLDMLKWDASTNKFTL